MTPAACRLRRGQVLPTRVSRVVARAGAAAVRTDFAAALTRTLWFQVGVFAGSFALMLALPRGAGRRRAAGDADPDDAGRADSNVRAAYGAVTG